MKALALLASLLTASPAPAGGFAESWALDAQRQLGEIVGSAREQAALTAARRSTFGFDPARTWVFVVGILKFQSGAFSPFPPADRRDEKLAAYFAARGVPADHIVLLEDGAATKDGIQRSLAATLAKTRPGDFLFLSYTGHGSNQEEKLYLATTDGKAYWYDWTGEDEEYPDFGGATFIEPATNWSAAAIFEAIESSFRGDQALVAIDACQSGVAAEQAKEKISRARVGLLTSAGRGIAPLTWTFADTLLASLEAAPAIDVNGDGRVTFEELAAAEKGSSTFTGVNGFDRGQTLSNR